MLREIRQCVKVLFPRDIIFNIERAEIEKRNTRYISLNIFPYLNKSLRLIENKRSTQQGERGKYKIMHNLNLTTTKNGTKIK